MVIDIKNKINKLKSKLKKLIKDSLIRVKRLITEYIGDFFILSGLAVLNITTYLLNTIAGLYLTGTILFLLGVYFALNLTRGR